MPPNMIGANVNTPMAEPWQLIVTDEITPRVIQIDDMEAYREIEIAAFILNRSLPGPHRLGPLYRKYYKVKNSDTTYAFGVLEENRKEVQGTQGWSVQMALQQNKNVYVYDDKTRQWYKGDRFEASLPDNATTVLLNRFKPCDPPTLAQKSNITLPVSLGNHTSYELEKLLARRC